VRRGGGSDTTRIGEAPSDGSGKPPPFHPPTQPRAGAGPGSTSTPAPLRVRVSRRPSRTRAHWHARAHAHAHTLSRTLALRRETPIRVSRRRACTHAPGTKGLGWEEGARVVRAGVRGRRGERTLPSVPTRIPIRRGPPRPGHPSPLTAGGRSSESGTSLPANLSTCCLPPPNLLSLPAQARLHAPRACSSTPSTSASATARSGPTPATRESNPIARPQVSESTRHTSIPHPSPHLLAPRIRPNPHCHPIIRPASVHFTAVWPSLPLPSIAHLYSLFSSRPHLARSPLPHPTLPLPPWSCWKHQGQPLSQAQQKDPRHALPDRFLLRERLGSHTPISRTTRVACGDFEGKL
jgi:hypothetical protein